MARVKYDVSGVETGNRKTPPAGVYTAKITQADVNKPDGKDTRIELILELQTKDEHNGYKLYEYVNLESEAARWKLRELLEAVEVTTDGKGEAGTLDTDRMLMNKTIGVKTQIRPADEARGYPESARAQRMFALDPADVGEDLDGDAVAEVDTTVEDDEVDLEAMSRKELKALIKDDNLEIRVVKSMTDDDVRKAIEAAWDEDEEDEEEPEEEPEEEDEPDDEPEVEAAEADEAPDDYDDWSLDDVKEELEQRSLSVKGSKKAMVMRLRKDDAEEDKPF